MGMRTRFENIMSESLVLPESKNRDQSCKWLGLEYENEMVSALCYKILRKHNAVYLVNIATDPRFRQNGYGTDLLDYFIVNVNQQASRTIFFYCDPVRRQLYEKRGAALAKRRKVKKIIRDNVPSQCVCMKFPAR